MKRNGFISAFFMLFLIGGASAVNLSRVNISWQYDPLAELKVRSRAIEVNNRTTVFFRIRTSEVASWTYEFLLQNNYESEIHQELDGYKIDTLLSEANQKIVSITFNKKNNNLLVLRISQPGIFYYHDTSLKNGSISLAPIYPVDKDGLPIFEGYINTNNYTWSGSSLFHALQYRENFQLAEPPMADMRPLAPSVDLDSSFTFSDSANFEENFFYIVRKDSNASESVTILKEAVYFPEFRKLEELMESMLYITNEPEKKALINSRDPKKSFDSFWMNTYNTQFRAKNAIRSYYSLVTQANRFFTDFKQGWKTDRGMIYIVFGVPDEVYRSDNKEEWFYDQGPNFEFTIISTFFAPRTYALRRNQNLEDTWYEYIAALRRGINE